MTYRVALIGTSQWLLAPPVRELRRNRRLIVHTGVDPVAQGGRLSASDIAMIQWDSAADPGLGLIHALTVGDNSTRCIAVSADDDDETLRRCIEADAWGHILEESSPSVYLEAVFRVAAGRLAYPSEVLDRIVTHGGRMTLKPGHVSLLGGLAPEERALLKLLAEGLNTPAAAKRLCIDPSEARRRRSRLMRKLGLKNRASLVRFAIRAGLVEL